MRIAVFIHANSWDTSLDERSMGQGLGGRETALVSLSMAWAEAGHQVWAFVPRDDHRITRLEPLGGVVHWIPFQNADVIAPALGLDLFISWESTEILAAMVGEDIGHRVIHMQVAHLVTDIVPVSPVCDTVVCLSEWAGRYFNYQHPDARVEVIANGVDLKRFERGRNPDDQDDEVIHLVYSSSPDRGLHHLLNHWPLIRNTVTRELEVGDTHLHVCYGIENFVNVSRYSHRSEGDRALAVEQKIDQDGITYWGRVGQDDLARLMMRSHALAYPCDTIAPTETGCISIVEALAAGMTVATTDCDCIGEDYGAVTVQSGLPFQHEDFIGALVEALHPEDYAARVEEGLEFVKQRDWKYIANQWIEKFS